MPLFMAVHDHIEGLTADAVAKAHQADLDTQAKYKVADRLVEVVEGA